MNNLIILCGSVGCGKSIFIERFVNQHQNFTHVDVFNYIQKYKDESGHIESSGSLKAHQELHQDLVKMDGDIILELGTNRAELNMNNLGRLSARYKINIIFCLLDAETCIKRVMARAGKSQKRIINKEDLEKKFKRVFPDNHIKLTQKLNLSYITMDMSLPFKDKLEVITNLVEKV